MVTPKFSISVFTWPRIADMIRSRSADSTSSSLSLPSTRRRLPVTTEFSRPRISRERADGLVEAKRIGDAEHGERVDDQPALVAQDHFLARKFNRQQALSKLMMFCAIGHLACNPGSSIGRTTLPNCTTSTCSVVSR